MDERTYTKEEVVQLLKDCIFEWGDYAEQKHPDHEHVVNDYIEYVLKQ